MSCFPIAVTADDLTGAADSAAALARPKAAVPVSLTPPPRAWQGRKAFAVNTDSRTCSPEEAHRRVRESVGALRAIGAGVIYKKIDSNLRGNIGAEVAAVREAMGATVVLAPAFPARGRTTRGGVLLVNGAPVSETEMAHDPQAPVTESEIVALLRATGGDCPISCCRLAAVRAGAGQLRESFRAEGVVVCDAETDADLDIIAEAALSLSPVPALVGSAGLVAAVGRRLLGPPEPTRWAASSAAPILGVLASASANLPRQVAAAAESGDIGAVPLLCARLSREEQPLPELNETIAQALAELTAGRNALVHAVGPLPDVAAPVDLVVEHLSHLAFVLARKGRPQGLLVGGGATALGVLSALKAEAIEVDDQPLPGIAAGLVVAGEFAGRPVVLKPGAAGEEQAVAQLFAYLGRRAAALEREP